MEGVCDVHGVWKRDNTGHERGALVMRMVRWIVMASFKSMLSTIIY